MCDILFKTNDYVFSYRIAGICIQNGRVLLQKPINDSGFAFPGGHAAFGETNEETLIREFKEEIGADISVNELKWVGEIFFPWGEKPCHQICLYYMVTIEDGHTPREGVFMAQDQLDGRNFEIEFHWIPMEKINDIELYPNKATQLLERLDDGVQHFIDREE